MTSFPASGTSSRVVALLILAVATATIAGALASQHVFGLVPCKLCLQQRWPYYIGVLLAAVTAAVPPGVGRRSGFALLGLVFLAGTALAAFHAGVEWGLWPGPTDCAGGSGPQSRSVDDLLGSLERIRVVNCSEAAWRLFGLSLAGWNAIISLGLAGLAGTGAACRPIAVQDRQGSSSVSQ